MCVQNQTAELLYSTPKTSCRLSHLRVVQNMLSEFELVNFKIDLTESKFLFFLLFQLTRISVEKYIFYFWKQNQKQKYFLINCV